MSNSNNVDVAINGNHVSGVRQSYLGAGAPIALPAGTAVREGDSITVDGKPVKVANVIMDRITNQADETSEHINIYITPVEE